MLRLAVRVRREDAEVALAELLALAPSGVEETDLGDRVEYAIYGAPGELPLLPDLQAAAGDALVDVSTSEVADDWAERWRDFHRPIEVGGRLLVRASWHPPCEAGPTLDGPEPVEIAAGTQPGEVIVLHGKGMPVLQRAGRSGDLRVVVNVVIPRRLSSAQREIVQQLADSITPENLEQHEGLGSKLRRLLHR
ncbi:MAG: ribosomal protein methyltransferase [Solirubrobacteraceae bacterium]|nr:ribosomal protein methyltransferase [Solirubrobacteraceae bacterium]